MIISAVATTIRSVPVATGRRTSRREVHQRALAVRWRTTKAA